MELRELLLIFIFLFLIISIGFIFKTVFYKKHPIGKYFMPALFLKLIGALAFCSVYNFYYTGGDTTAYFKYSLHFTRIILENPWEGLRVIFSELTNYELVTHGLNTNMNNVHYSSMYMIYKIAGVLNLVGMSNFWTTTLLFTMGSFSGLCALYHVFVDVYPRLYKQIAIAVFWIPSVFFWGSGILKDTVTIGCIGWLVYGFYHLCIKRDKIIISIALIIISAYLIDVIKGYILAAALPGLLIWCILHYWYKVKDAYLKSFLFLSLMSTIGGSIVLMLDRLQVATQNALLSFVSRALDFQNWHGLLAETLGASGYDLGEIEFTWLGILSKFPAAVNVALFRPYLFEAYNPVMLMAAIESTVFLFFTLYVWFKTGFFCTFRIIFQHPIIFFCLFFSFTFAFAVGFTSYNFGALVRYKIPCLPFYMAALFMILHEGTMKKISVNPNLKDV